MLVSAGLLLIYPEEALSLNQWQWAMSFDAFKVSLFIEASSFMLISIAFIIWTWLERKYKYQIQLLRHVPFVGF